MGSAVWYHGSPSEIDLLRVGSTITRDRELAQAFSHKPGLLSLDDDPALVISGVRRIRHNGTQPGLLYVIDEPLEQGDIIPHPNSSIGQGYEWLTTRPLKLRLLGPVAIAPGELLSEEEIEEFRRRK